MNEVVFVTNKGNVSASSLQPGDKVVGLAGELNQIIGVTKRTIGHPYRLFRINYYLDVCSDQLIWTSKGWGAVSTSDYNFIRFSQMEYLPEFKAFSHPVIDVNKLAQIEIGTELELSNGLKESVHSIEEITSSHLGNEYFQILSDGNQSAQTESGVIVETKLSILIDESKVLGASQNNQSTQWLEYVDESDFQIRQRT
jgi:hypothetical protein